MKFDEISDIREQMEALAQSFPQLSQKEYDASDDGDKGPLDNDGDDRVVPLSPEDSEKKHYIFRISTVQ